MLKKIKHLFSSQPSTLLSSFCQIIHFYLPVGYNYKSDNLTVYTNPVNSKFMIWQLLLSNEISRFLLCLTMHMTSTWCCQTKLKWSDDPQFNIYIMYQFLTESHHKTIVVFRSIRLFSYPCSKIFTLASCSSDLVNIIFFEKLKHSSDPNTSINYIIYTVVYKCW